jgi:hypothetical protein
MQVTSCGSRHFGHPVGHIEEAAVSPGCADSDGALDFWFGFACPAWCAGRPYQR